MHEIIGPAELYAINGLQFLPFNTIYQLAAEQHSPLWADAGKIVLLPDLLAYWLTGELRTEITNASTTGLLDARSRTWSDAMLGRGSGSRPTGCPSWWSRASDRTVACRGSRPGPA